MRRFQPLPHPVGLMMLIVAGAFLVGNNRGLYNFLKPAAGANNLDRWSDGSSLSS